MAKSKKKKSAKKTASKTALKTALKKKGLRLPHGYELKKRKK